MDAGHQIELVITQPDRPGGRGLALRPSPVKQLASDLKLVIEQPERIRDAAAQSRIRELDPDVLVVVAYGQILPAALIGAPRLGTVNVHASLLPRHRGPAPVEWSILSGDPETGVTIMQMDAGVDTGPVLSQARVPIGPNETASELEERLAEVGGRLLVETLEQMQRGEVEPVPQPTVGATHARRLSGDDGKLREDMTAVEIDRRVRALGDRVGVWLKHPMGEIKLLKGHVANGQGTSGMPIVTKDGTYIVEEVQQPGGRRMSAEAWMRGRH